MEKVISYSLSENYIHNLASFIEENYIREAKDISKLALVFGGKRPELFLKRELALRLGKTFFGPRFFSIDEYKKAFIDELNAVYVAFTRAKYELYAFIQKKNKQNKKIKPIINTL